MSERLNKFNKLQRSYLSTPIRKILTKILDQSCSEDQKSFGKYDRYEHYDHYVDEPRYEHYRDTGRPTK